MKRCILAAAVLAIASPVSIRWEQDKPLGDWGQFDLGIPEAREFMTGYLATVIRQYQMDWLRIDSGLIPAFAREKDQKTADRTGMTEIRYVEGLYRMWDDLRVMFPQLAIDHPRRTTDSIQCCVTRSKVLIGFLPSDRVGKLQLTFSDKNVNCKSVIPAAATVCSKCTRSSVE